MKQLLHILHLEDDLLDAERVESKFNKGSRFAFTLPVRRTLMRRRGFQKQKKGKGEMYVS